jgi:hypothetical protein
MPRHVTLSMPGCTIGEGGHVGETECGYRGQGVWLDAVDGKELLSSEEGLSVVNPDRPNLAQGATGDGKHIAITGNWQVTARVICASP